MTIEENGDIKCPKCDGQGFKLFIDDFHPEWGVVKSQCQTCFGKGKTNWVDLIVPDSKKDEIIGFSGHSGYSGFSGYSYFSSINYYPANAQLGYVYFDVSSQKSFALTTHGWRELA